MLRYLPPSGVPITPSDIISGLWSCLHRSTVKGFKSDICRYFNVEHCCLTSSGRAALSTLFQALHQLSPNQDEVVLPAFTSFSVPSAVANAGLRVALYDLDGENLSPDIASLREAISERTLCVVVCHLYGYPCDMDAVLAVTRGIGVPVIDDAAQAMGAIYRGHRVGTMGEAGVFSLSRGKNISTVEGGIIVTNSTRLVKELEKMEPEQVGIRGHLGLIGRALILSALLHPMVYGIPARIPSLHLGASVFEPDFPVSQFTPFQAGIGRRMLRRLERINSTRRQKARFFTDRLASHTRLPEIVSGAEPVFLRLPVFVRNASTAAKISHGIVPSYPTSVSEIESLKPLLTTAGDFPSARKLSREIVTLPTHQFLNRSDMFKIVALSLMEN
jgi:perosamine synthetase